MSLNGGVSVKVFISVVGIMLAAVTTVGGYAIGGNRAASEIREHTELPAHPVIQERVNNLDTRISDRLLSIDQRLLRIEQKLDAR